MVYDLIDDEECGIDVAEESGSQKYPTVTARLPRWARERLEEAARRDRHSVAFIVRELLLWDLEEGREMQVVHRPRDGEYASESEAAEDPES